MKSYWIKTHPAIKRIFSNFIWDRSGDEKTVYLTFDDGPTPQITEWVLQQLERHQAKATFFCIGKNIESHPEILKKVIAGGHSVGNHTFNHLNGWKTNCSDYIENTIKCETLVERASSKKLFRPPYGKITPSQASALRRADYKIVMWEILSADFDQSVDPQVCLENVVSNIEPGSIVIFHDSVKAFKNLEFVLPRTLKFLSANGYRCDAL